MQKKLEVFSSSTLFAKELSVMQKYRSFVVASRPEISQNSSLHSIRSNIMKCINTTLTCLGILSMLSGCADYPPGAYGLAPPQANGVLSSYGQADGSRYYPSPQTQVGSQPDGDYCPVTRTDRGENLQDIRIGLTLLGLYRTEKGRETPIWAQLYANVESKNRIKAGFCGIYYPITRPQADVACETLIKLAATGLLATVSHDDVAGIVRQQDSVLAANDRFIDAIVGIGRDI